MKKLYSLILLLAFGMYTYAQQVPADTVKNKAYYQEKRITQRTTGWIFFGVGSAAVIIGVIMYSSQPFLASDKDNTGAGVMAAGAVSMLASIPFFVASHKSNLKAMQLSVGPKMERNDQLIQIYAARYQPAVSLRLNF